MTIPTLRERQQREARVVLEEMAPRPTYYKLIVQLVAQHTRVVGNLIYYPFVILLLMLLSRHRVFDAYDWPTSLVIVFLVGFGLVAGSGLALRRSVERLRTVFIGRLQHELTLERVSMSGSTENDIEAAIESIRAEQRGAFGPFSENPVVRALLIPFGGLGTIGLLEKVVTSLHSFP